MDFFAFMGYGGRNADYISMKLSIFALYDTKNNQKLYEYRT